MSGRRDVLAPLQTMLIRSFKIERTRYHIYLTVIKPHLADFGFFIVPQVSLYPLTNCIIVERYSNENADTSLLGNTTTVNNFECEIVTVMSSLE